MANEDTAQMYGGAPWQQCLHEELDFSEHLFPSLEDGCHEAGCLWNFERLI